MRLSVIVLLLGAFAQSMAFAEDPKTKEAREKGEVKAEATFNVINANDGTTGVGGQATIVLVPRTHEWDSLRDQVTLGAGYAGGQAVGELAYWQGRPRRREDGPGVALAKGFGITASPQSLQATGGISVLIPIRDTLLEINPRLPYTSLFYFRADDYGMTSWGGIKVTLEHYLSPEHPVALQIWGHADALTNGHRMGIVGDGQGGNTSGVGLYAGGGFGIKGMMFGGPFYLIASVEADHAAIKAVEIRPSGGASSQDVGFTEISTRLGVGIDK